MSDAFTVTTDPDELKEGLFGQVLLHAFVVLPHLAARGLQPSWAIRSRLYGSPVDGVVLPGVLDLAYATPADPGPSVPLHRLIARFGSTLGDDWEALSRLWSRYFRMPPRLLRAADAHGSLDDALGVHYRGNDKGTGNWDSNPVSHDEMTLIVQDALKNRPELARVFVATDDFGFVSHLEQRLDRPVVNLGRVTFHLDASDGGSATERADRAMLDCLLLSRCASVLLNSSALSAFTKVLRPELEVRRCAASMFFTDVPYFPVAFIPVYTSDDPAVREILSRTMANDWRHSPRAAAFHGFAARPRFRAWDVAWSVAGFVDRMLRRRPAGLRPDSLGRTLLGRPPQA